MFFAKDKASKCCENCCYWEKVYKYGDIQDDDLMYGLGHCRIHPPSRVEKRAIITTKEYERCVRLRGKEEHEYLDWSDKQEERQDQVRDKIYRMQESIRTATHPDSVKHWTNELKKFEEKLDKIYMEEFKPFHPSQVFEEDRTIEKPIDIYLGKWPLTASNDFCGEWRE